MGKHVRRRFHLPPGAKPRHRFVIALSAIVLLAFGSMAGVAVLNPENGPLASDVPAQSDPFPINGLPDAGPMPTGELTAAYTVPPDWTWGNGFQAQVAITNPGPAPQNWQVKLVYPDAVTTFVGSWLGEDPLPAPLIDGNQFLFTGLTSVGPGQTVLLKVQFDKMPLADFTVSQCLVNARDCTLG